MIRAFTCGTDSSTGAAFQGFAPGTAQQCSIYVFSQSEEIGPRGKRIENTKRQADRDCTWPRVLGVECNIRRISRADGRPYCNVLSLSLSRCCGRFLSRVHSSSPAGRYPFSCVAELGVVCFHHGAGDCRRRRACLDIFSIRRIDKHHALRACRQYRIANCALGSRNLNMLDSISG